MSRFMGRDTFDLDSIVDPFEISELSGDEETFYFKIIEEDNETSDSFKTSTINEIVYSNDDAPLSQIIINNVISSIVNDKGYSEVESQLEEIINYEKLNSNITPDKDQSEVEYQLEKIIDCEKLKPNITPDKQKESTGNIDSVTQNDTFVIIDDSDENTGQLETEQTAPVVNLTNILFIKHQKGAFPAYYNKKIYTKMIHFLSNKTMKEVVNPILRSADGCLLIVSELMTVLTPETWLNDAAIQCYMSLLVNNCDKTFAVTTYLLNSCKFRGYDSVFRWFKKNDLNNSNRMVVPVNPDGIHWALFVVEIWKGKIYSFDSYPDPLVQKEYPELETFLNKAINDYIKYSGVKRNAPERWDNINMKSPPQFNTTDCGIFTCMNARCFLLGTPPKFTQEDIPILRQIIAWELINNKLEDF